MNILLNIQHHWKPEGLAQFVTLCRKTNPWIGQWIWEAARELPADPQVVQDNGHPQENKA